MAGKEGYHVKLRSRSDARASKPLPALKKVLLDIPTDDDQLEQLRRNLERMGCAGLLDVPWAVREEGLIRDIIGPVSNVWDNTLRGNTEEWTSGVWRDVYGFAKGNVKQPERIEEFLEGEFRHAADPKDGYSVKDLKDPEARMVVGFLNPIFHPEKPKRLISMWASTILGSFRGKLKIDWAHLMVDLIDRLVKNARNSKSKAGTPLAPYLAHLYAKHELLRPEAQQQYEELLNIQKYGGPESGSEPESDSPEPADPSPATSSKPGKRDGAAVRASEESPRKKGKGVAKGARPSGPAKASGRTEKKERPASTQAPDIPELTGQPHNDILELCNHIALRTPILHEHDVQTGRVITGMLKALDCPPGVTPSDRIATLVRDAAKTREIKEEVKLLHAEANSLRTALEKAGKDKKEAEVRANASAQALAGVKEALAIPVDVFNKAHLFEARLERDDQLSRGPIIRFLTDQSRKMEKTWEQMRELVANMTPEGPAAQGTQTGPADMDVVSSPAQPTPNNAGPPGNPVVDLAGSTDSSEGPPVLNTPTPTLAASYDWRDFDMPSATELLKPIPGAELLETPSPFRVPAAPGKSNRRKSTGEFSRREVQTPEGPAEGYQALIETQIRSSGKKPSGPPTLPLTPVNSPASGTKDKASGSKDKATGKKDKTKDRLHPRTEAESGSASGEPAPKKSSQSRGSQSLES